MRETWRRMRAHKVGGHLLRFRPLSLVFALVMVLGHRHRHRGGADRRGHLRHAQGAGRPPLDPAHARPQGRGDLLPRPDRRCRQPDGRALAPGTGAQRLDRGVVGLPHRLLGQRGVHRGHDATSSQWADEQTGEPVRLFVSGSMGAHGLAQRHAARRRLTGLLVRRQAGRRPDQDGARSPAPSGSSRRPSTASRCPRTATRRKNIDKLSTDTRYRFVASRQRPMGPLRREHRSDGRGSGRARRGREHPRGHRAPTTTRSHFNVGDLIDFASTCGA